MPGGRRVEISGQVLVARAGAALLVAVFLATPAAAQNSGGDAFYRECMIGFGETAPGGSSGEDYCKCLADRYVKDENGFRTALDELEALEQEDIDDAALAAAVASNAVIEQTVQTCAAPMVEAQCLSANRGERDDVESYCGCLVDALIVRPGGLAVLLELYAAGVTDPRNDPQVLAILESCD